MLDERAILGLLQDLHEPETYKQVIGLLDQHWMDILSDPCSRINSTLVRPASKAFFLEYSSAMSKLLEQAHPYGPRSDAFPGGNECADPNASWGCPEYARIWPDFQQATNVAELPFLHVGLFKHIPFKTQTQGINHERTLKSSATSSGVSSLITLDQTSSSLQSASTLAILKDFVGDTIRPFLILDSSRSLMARGEISARIAAAMSLRPLASEMYFLLNNANDPASVKWDLVSEQLRHSR